MNRLHLAWTTALASILLLSLSLPTVAPAEEAAQKVVVHIGHATDDLHSASMGMSLARALQKKGASVTVFLDREGVRLADDDMPKSLGWGKRADPVVEILSDFMKAGGRVVLCPHCAQMAGIDDDDLLEGARIASDADVAELFLAADKVIDY
jgi:predicted peroxiredoxin